MNRETFIRELRLKIARLPQEELEAAIAYYEEYFDEAGPEYEAEIIKELGSPPQIAKQIMGEHVLREAEQKPMSPKKSLGAVWIVILAIFASPIAFPLAIAFVAVLFALGVTVVSLLFAGVVTVAALGIGFVVAIVASFTTLFIHPATGVFMIGTALTLGGIALLVGLLLAVVIRKGIPALTTMIVKAFNRLRGEKKVC
ncbi:MAG: DUF1700 domain-containing protein [Cellulosilyticaceae bacterium]